MAITRPEPTEEYLAELMDDCTAMIVRNFELETPEQRAALAEHLANVGMKLGEA